MEQRCQSLSLYARNDLVSAQMEGPVLRRHGGGSNWGDETRSIDNSSHHWSSIQGDAHSCLACCQWDVTADWNAGFYLWWLQVAQNLRGLSELNPPRFLICIFRWLKSTDPANLGLGGVCRCERSPVQASFSSELFLVQRCPGNCTYLTSIAV